MDADRFDDVLRALTASRSRRGMARAVAGLTVAGLTGSMLGLSRGEAKHKKRKKKKRKCKSGTKKCGKTCIPSASCCSDADCPAGSRETCQEGECQCPAGQSLSGGVCGTIPIGCSEPGVPCDEGPCCSATCAPGEGGDVCQPSAEGEPCVRDDYCEIGLQCVGFVCQPLSV